jgi:hypothetical protein
LGFKASEAVAALVWDLRPFAELHGVAPEPSQAALDAYEDAMMATFSDSDLDLPVNSSEQDIEQALEASILARFEGQSLVEARPALRELHADIRKRRMEAASAVCGGSPTVKELEALPARPRELFLGWVASWAVDPTQSQDVTSP